MNVIRERLARHRAGQHAGIYSVCSAHPLVIEAALVQARETGDVALIEATSNQVNQDGGYTGLRPAEFRDLVLGIARAVGLEGPRVLLGGDHLGPNCWQSGPADVAMAKADRLIADYVHAGFRKIHLDCSMACAGEPAALGDELIAARTARLAAHAESAWQASGGEPPVYVIGSEVPVPGGAREVLDHLAVTRPEAALATVEAHRVAFAAAGLRDAWDRVVALVVQPGVEFGHDTVVDYRPERAAALSAAIRGVPHLVYEAHSTDYQTRRALTDLVRDHYAILKVGPATTFALREALWALDSIVAELNRAGDRLGLRATVLAALHADPSHWRAYYESVGAALDLQLQYSLSDRIRYYWTVPAVRDAVERLFATFDAAPPPPALVAQFLPSAVDALRAGRLQLRARDLVIHHVRGVVHDYSAACRFPES